jgi:hypothetical protein
MPEGQHLQSDQYSIRAANAVPVGQKTAAATPSRFLLRSQETSIVEQSTIAPDGLLLIERPLPKEVGTKHDRLIFQRAKRLSLGVVK